MHFLQRAAALALLTIAPLAAASEFLVPPDGFTIEGCFEKNETNGKAYWEDRSKTGLPQFASCAGTAANNGVFRTAWFVAPGTLRFYVSGATSTPGIRLYLEARDRPRQLDLRSVSDPIIWRERTWDLPADWQGAVVRVVAEDRSAEAFKGWIGLTLPQSGRGNVIQSLARAIYRCVFLCLEGLLFLIPGLAAALLIARCRALPGYSFIALVVVCSAVVAYAIFWAYVKTKVAGQLLSFVVPVVGLGYIAFFCWRWRSSLPSPVWREAGLCLLGVMLTALLSCGCGFLYLTDDTGGELAQGRYLPYNLPPDNVLPLLFAERLYWNASLTENLVVCAGSTTGCANHGSDRPPLQAALVLFEYPYWFFITKALSYQMFGVWLQCTWVAGVWVLLRAAAVSHRVLAVTLAFSILSSFCVVHSFFVWPKLLSATFFLIALSCVPQFRRDRNGWSVFDAMLAGASVALSLLSHPNCFFTLAPLAALVVFAPGRPGWRAALAGSGILIALMLPWNLYQTYIDPTRNGLLKLHLAGSVDPNVSLLQALRIAYGQLTPAQFLHGKAENLHTLFGDPLAVLRAGGANARMVAFVRILFFSLVMALGVLNLGFLARVFSRASEAVRSADRMMLLALASTAFWVVAMFQGGSTWIHQGSFGQMLLLQTALGMYLAARFDRLTWIALALQAFVFVIGCVIAMPIIRAEPGAVWNVHMDPGMAVVMIGSLVGLALMGRPAKIAQ